MGCMFQDDAIYKRAQQKSKINRISLFNSYSESLSMVPSILGNTVDPMI